MKNLSIFTVSLLMLCTFGCNNPKYDATDGTDMKDSLINDVIIESFEFLIADTIINPRLACLMDTLYRYTQKKVPINDIHSYLKWMKEFRNQASSYYKETHKSDSISDFAMADSIIAEMGALCKLNKDGSTAGIVTQNNAELSMLVFEQFNEYEKLKSICKTEKEKEELLAEFTEWLRLQNLFNEIFANCVDLHYWGGTGSGPLCTQGELQIWKAHTNLYKKEYSLFKNRISQLEGDGTFLIPSRNLLIDCCNKALDESYCPDDSEYMFEKGARYEALYTKTKSLLKKLPEHIDAWCISSERWANQTSPDWLYRSNSHLTSEVLIKLAHIISSVE